jgi:hypothetical protein
MLLTFQVAPSSRASGQSQQPTETLIATAAPSGRDTDSTGKRKIGSPSRKWRVVVTDPLVGGVTRKALDTAATWLEKPSCADVLTDFSDPAGHPLAERLILMDVDVLTYLTWVLFIDDTRNPSCREGVVAIAVPGSRVVRLCGDVFKRTWQQNSTFTVAALIHEMLHTLGLEENPPSSSEITRRVLVRCRPVPTSRLP